jgi:hypothetical protein
MGRFYFGQASWCPGGFLYLNGQNFLKIWEIFCYYFIEYTINPFCLDLFSFFMPMILRFGLLMKLVSSCIFLSQLLSCLTFLQFFSLISILSSTSEILSSTCSSLLEWPSTVFCVSVWFFYLRFSIFLVTSSLIFFICIFNSFLSL